MRYLDLDDEAREFAIDQFRQFQSDTYHDWAVDIIDEFVKNCKIIGVEIDSRKVHFDSRDHGRLDVGFDFNYSYVKESCVKIRKSIYDLEFWAIADSLRNSQRKKFYRVYGYKKSGWTELFTGNHYECEKDDSDRFYTGPAGEIEDLFNDLNNWIVTRLQNEWDYLNSHDYIDESLSMFECDRYNEKGEKI